MKYVIFIPDGSSDYPIDELDGMTPLMAADTPNIDKMAKAGFGGLTNNVPDAYTPGSDVANMSIFGFNPADYYTGRGPLEAGSMGIETTDKDVISDAIPLPRRTIIWMILMQAILPLRKLKYLWTA